MTLIIYIYIWNILNEAIINEKLENKTILIKYILFKKTYQLIKLKKCMV